MKQEAIKPHCPLDVLLRIISGPWTSYVLWVLANHGPVRFGELKRKVPGISARLLTDRLRKLEDAGLVARDYKATIPPEVSYSLSPRGSELRSVLNQINVLAVDWDLASPCAPDKAKKSA